MNSTTSSPSGFFSSPRRQQQLLWIAGAVLVTGVVVFLVVFFSRGSSQPTSVDLSTVSSPQTSTTPAPPRVPPSSAARQVARTFLLTAVQRKNLDAAYRIVGPDLKGGMSLAQWRKGNIPVTFYPSSDAKTAQFVVKTSHPSYLLLQVGLHALRGSGIKPRSLAFWLGLKRVGGKNGEPARWLVNYFLPQYSIPVKANPYSN